MPERSKASVEVQSDTNIVNNAETLVAGPVFIPVTTGDPIIAVKATVTITSDAAATGFTILLRRGVDASGALINESNPEGLYAAAGGTETHVMTADDGPLGQGVIPYVVTVTRAGAAGTSVAKYVHLSAERG